MNVSSVQKAPVVSSLWVSFLLFWFLIVTLQPCRLLLHRVCTEQLGDTVQTDPWLCSASRPTVACIPVLRYFMDKKRCHGRQSCAWILAPPVAGETFLKLNFLFCTMLMRLPTFWVAMMIKIEYWHTKSYQQCILRWKSYESPKQGKSIGLSHFVFSSSVWSNEQAFVEYSLCPKSHSQFYEYMTKKPWDSTSSVTTLISRSWNYPRKGLLIDQKTQGVFSTYHQQLPKELHRN